MIKKQVLILETHYRNYTLLKNILRRDSFKSIAILNFEDFENIKLNIYKFNILLVNTQINYIDIKDIIQQTTLSNIIKIPIIFIDGSKEYDSKFLAKCFRYGASDYIKKPFDSIEILARVNYHYNQFFILNEYKLKINKLINLETINKLTSRMRMQIILKYNINYFNRYKLNTTIIYLSLTNIDKIMNIFGLKKSEKLISIFAKELKECIRKSDILSKWANSEFIILLPNTTTISSKIIVKKIKSQLLQIGMLDGIISELAFGITSFKEDDIVIDVLKRVQDALNQAKKQTHGNIFIY